MLKVHFAGVQGHQKLMDLTAGVLNFSWCLYDLILTVHYTSFACMLQLDRQNRSLKRKSMMLLSHISPETIADIDLNDEAEESEDLHASSHDCLSPQCCTSTSGTVESKAYTVLTDLTYSIHSFIHQRVFEHKNVFTGHKESCESTCALVHLLASAGSDKLLQRQTLG